MQLYVTLVSAEVFKYLNLSGNVVWEGYYTTFMSQNSSSDQLLNPVTLALWIAQRSYIWQMNFLSAKDLAEFAHKHGLSWYREEHIYLLWKLGILKADLVASSQEVDDPGLILVGQEQQDEDENEFLYADARLPQLILDSPTLLLEEMQSVPSTLKVFFHPFRFAVLQNFERLIPNFEPPRVLYPQLYQMAKSMDIWLQGVKPTQQFLRHAEHWNDVVSLLVATEPCFYERIFQHLHFNLFHTRPTVRRWAPDDDSDTIINAGFEELRAEIERHTKDVVTHYHSIDIKRLEQLHQDLCVQTQLLDKNRTVHTILRLGKSKLRLELEGQLGGAMLLRTMAEMLRRATEKAFAIQLREEDERGYGLVPENVKERAYGSNRLLDGDRNADNEFLRQYGLFYGPRLRWYVEGETEFWGLSDFFRTIGATDIEILNLRGQFVQRNSIAFRESLRSDIRMGIFSFVSLDADVSKNVQALRAAAQQDQICGCFFISAPDFEFANFDLSELQEIVWSIALERGADVTKKFVFLTATSTANNGRIFFRKIEQTVSDISELWNIGKGEEWGKQLVQYALSHPKKINGEVRLCISAIRQSFTSRTVNYNYNRLHYQVNAQTGQPVKRDMPMTREERLKEF